MDHESEINIYTVYNRCHEVSFKKEIINYNKKRQKNEWINKIKESKNKKKIYK